jgi:hypothetical protein
MKTDSLLNLSTAFNKAVIKLNSCPKPKLHYDWQSVGQFVLVWGIHLRFTTKFSFCFSNFFTQLRICWYGMPSLTKWWVCSLQLLLGLDRAVFVGFDFRGTHDHIFMSQSETVLRLVGLLWRYSNPPPHGSTPIRRSRSYFMTDSQSVSMSWYRVPL